MTYVTVDTVNSPDQYSDSIAKDIFREVMEQILPYLNVEPMKEEVKAEDTKKQIIKSLQFELKINIKKAIALIKNKY